MSEQIQGAIIGGSITSAFAVVGFLCARFFKKSDESHATLSLLVSNMQDVNGSMKRLHERMSEFFAQQKESIEEIHDIDKRVAIIEKDLES